MAGSHRGRLVDLALSQGWLHLSQADSAFQMLSQARASGHSVRIGQALVHAGALNEAQVHSLLEQLGLAVFQCQQCQQAFNGPLQSTGHLRCPQDGQALIRSGTLQVNGDLGLGEASSYVNAVSQQHAHSSVSNQDLRQSTSQGSVTQPAPQGKYDLGKELGRGGMGAVYLAQDRELNRDVAMKVILSVDKVDAIDRFREEARLTGQLEHPNIIPVHELGVQGDQPFFTMKFVRGQSLEQLIKAHAQGEAGFSLARTLGLFLKILDGVGFAHAHNVIHRDLKPANIMLGEHGEVLVMDWGLAKALDPGSIDDNDRVASAQRQKGRIQSLRQAGGDSAWTMDGAITGTPGYMAPEQADGEADKVDFRSDIFSLGCILYEMLTFQRTFPGSAVQALKRTFEGKYDDPIQACKAIPLPVELAAIVRKSLHPQRSGRYQSIDGFHKDIESFLEGRSVSAHSDSLPVQIYKWMKRNPTITISSVVVIVAIAVVGAYIFLRSSTLRLKIQTKLEQRLASFQRDLDLEKPDLVIHLGDKRYPLKSEQAELELELWPPGIRELKVTCDDPRFSMPGGKFLKLESGGTQALSLTIQRKMGALPIQFSADTLFDVEATATHVPYVKDPPLFAQKSSRFGLLPTGEYRIRLSQPGVFPIVRTLKVTADASLQPRFQPLPEKNSLMLRNLESDIKDIAVADVNHDGFLDLVYAARNELTVLTLERHPQVLWSRNIQFKSHATNVVGNTLALLDFEGLGDLSLAYHDGSAIHLLNAATGQHRDDFSVTEARIRALDLDHDGRDELITATSYRGIQAFNGQGQRLWGRMTGKYAYWSEIHALPDTRSDNKSGVLVSAPQPLKGYFIDSEGRIVWRREFGDNSGGILRPLTQKGQDPKVLVLGKTNCKVLDGMTGEVLRTLSERFGRTMAGQFQGDETVVMNLGPKAIECWTGDLRTKLWSYAAKAASVGAFGDIDCDGQKEFIIAVNANAREQSVQLIALDKTGRLRHSLEIGSKNLGFSQLPPLVVSVDSLIKPSILFARGRKLGLYQFEARSFQILKARRRVLDLDDDGRLEILDVLPGRDIQVSGSLQWSLNKGTLSELMISPATMCIADVNRDGVKDIVYHGLLSFDATDKGSKDYCLLGLNGKDGQLLFREPCLGQIWHTVVADEGHANGPVILFFGKLSTGEEVVQKWRFKEDQGLIKAGPNSPWQISDGAPVYVQGSPSFVAIGDRRFKVGVLSLKDDSQVIKAWNPKLKSMKAPVAPAALMYHEGDVFVCDAYGHLYKAPRSGDIVQIKALDEAPRQMIVRKKGASDELVLVCDEGEFSVVDLKSMKLQGNFSLKAYKETGRIRVFSKDLTGDQVDELAVSFKAGGFVILDGQDFNTVLAASRYNRVPPIYDNFALAPQIIDADNDGALDFVQFTTRGTLFLSNLKATMQKMRDNQLVSDNQAINLQLFLRAARYWPSTALLKTRLKALPNRQRQVAVAMCHESLQSKLAARLKSDETAAAHLLDIGRKAALGQSLNEALLLRRSRRFFSNSLLSFCNRLSNYSLESRGVLLGHLRDAFDGQADSKQALIDLAKTQQGLGQSEAARETLETALALFPKDPSFRELYSRNRIMQALRKHWSFERVIPRKILEAALRVCETETLHFAYLWICMQRNFQPKLGYDGHHRRALEVAEHKAIAHAHWAYLLYEQHSRQARKNAQLQKLALEAVDKALKLAPRDLQVRAVAALVQATLRPSVEVLKELNAAIARGFDDPIIRRFKLYRARAELSLLRGDFEGSVKDLIRSLKAAPPSVYHDRDMLVFADTLRRKRQSALARVLLKQVQFSENQQLAKQAKALLTQLGGQ